MPEMKTLNGYEIVDAKAREDIVALQEAVENIEIPDSPGGEGGSGRILVEFYTAVDSALMNHDLLKEVYDYAYAGNNVFDKYDLIFKPSPNSTQAARVLSVTCKYQRITAVMYNPILTNSTDLYEYEYSLSTKRASIYEVKVLTDSNYTNYISSASGWQFATDFWDSNLYQAKEVYIMIDESSAGGRVFSHVVLPEGHTLSENFTYANVPLVTDPNSEKKDLYWYYTGYGIEFYVPSGEQYSPSFESSVVAYKV